MIGLSEAPMSNYELMMTYLEARRKERQTLGPQEIREWGQRSNIEQGYMAEGIEKK